jgi:dTDP-4-amino-4,6-dideoxygalactose transaminase
MNCSASQATRRIYMSPPHMSGEERALLLEAFDSNWIAPLGPHVDAFEREFAEKVGMPHAVALSSGTAALHLSLLLLGIGRDDEVLTSSFTFVATANAICYVNARPVFIDSDLESWNMDPQLLEDELTACRQQGKGKMPRAVLCVDINGQCADYARIVRICQEFEVPLIEDAAEALGARCNGQNAGTFGELAAFSFNGNKIITCSGGGMLVTRSKELAERARFLSTQARDPAPHYEHSCIGYNYRLSNLLAAVGRGQLRVLDDRVQRRREVCQAYIQRLGDLPGFTFMPEPAYSYSTRWLTSILIDPERSGTSRDRLVQALAERNIEARPLWKPMHMQPLFRGHRYRGQGVGELLFAQGICLPSGSDLTEAEIDMICEIIRAQGRQ